MNARWTLALALTLAVAAPALAQRPGGQGPGGGRFGQGPGMGGMGGGLLMPLMAPPVQEELKLSEEQIDQVQGIAEDLRGSMRGRFQELRDADPEERRERMEALVREQNAETRAKLKEVLDESQLDRLEQIHLQQQGVMAFADPEVREKIGLSEDQASTVEGVIASYRTEMRTIMEEARNAENRRGAMQKVMELRTSSLDEVKAVLSDEQKETWTEMTGEPFEMGFGRGGPGGRRGPGGPGGRRGGPPPAGN